MSSDFIMPEGKFALFPDEPKPTTSASESNGNVTQEFVIDRWSIFNCHFWGNSLRGEAARANDQ
jgi:hypothetical protein